MLCYPGRGTGAGLTLMQKAAPVSGEVRNLCRGPGKLCQALDITKAQYSADLRTNLLTVEPYVRFEDAQLVFLPGNIEYAEEAASFVAVLSATEYFCFVSNTFGHFYIRQCLAKITGHFGCKKYNYSKCREF